MDIENLNKIVTRVRQDLLAAFFLHEGIVLDESWKEFSSRNLQPLLDAFQRISKEAWEEAGRSIEKLARVGMNTKNLPMMVAALAEWKVKPPDDLATLSAANLAAWACVHLSTDRWQDLERRAEINAQPRGEWRFYNLDLESDQAETAVSSKRKALETAISKSVIDREFRGYGCEGECYTVGEAEYMIIRLTDYPERGDHWSADEKRFKPSDDPMAFRIVFVFERDCHRLGILHDGSAERCAELSRTFSTTVFGRFSRVEPVKYDLSSLRRKSALPAAEYLGIKSAKIIGMELWLDGSRARRRSYYELSRDIQAVMAAELPNAGVVADDKTLVKRVTIQITYETRRGPNTAKSFTVSEGSIGGISDPNHGIGKAFKAYLQDDLHLVVVSDESDH